MRRLFQIFIVLFLGLLYALTIAPSLTWAHFSADGGDLLTAAAVNGVPHPAGYPLYLLLAKVFQSLPFGTLPFRTNLLSAVCSICASLWLFALIRRETEENPFHNEIALFGALAYGLAPAVWGQALVTEVYALHGLFVVLCLYALLSASLPEWLRGFLFGLAASNHLVSVLLFPLLFLYADKKGIVLRFAGVVGGLALYLILPLRALANPPVNWGNPSTLEGFIWLVGGNAYRDYAFNLSFLDVIGRLRAVAGLSLEQFTALGLLFALYDLLSLRMSRMVVATGWIAAAYTIFSVFYASYDSHVYLIALWVCCAIWVAVGFGDLLQLIRAHSTRAAQAILLSVFLLLVVRIPFTYPQVDLSHDRQADEFIQTTLDKIPENSILFVTGDEQVFPLWYAQFALHRREDVVIVAEGLLQFDWYRENLKHTYPTLTLPAALPIQPIDLLAVNPQRRVCYVLPDAVECP